MEKCKYESRLSSFLDDELSESEKAAMLSHLSSCEICSQMLEGYQQVDTWIKDLSQLEPSADFDRTFQEKLIANEAESGWRQYFGFFSNQWRPLLAAAITGCFLVGIFLYHGHDKDLMTPEDVLIVENVDFYQNFEIIQQLELYENWDSIHKLDYNS
jgi:hypothetical protein